MQMTLDGFVGGPNGELDWMTWDWSDDLKEYATELTHSFDTILLGRKMTDGFITHWEEVCKDPESPNYDAAKIFIDTPKITFSRTLSESKWDNTSIANSTDTIKELREQTGDDIIVYGGADFVSGLVKDRLIDEYYLFINPVALGNGLRIFDNVGDRMNLKLEDSIQFDCGIVLVKYLN
jgi:dihydrofolate reductase